ncbi:polyphosphate kinase 2 [Helicobacter winghamensis]|uniref:ADP/GDP-polyphosphate phosphotransferase n=1 Tax=Helicobacter winghamensis TaxID=157268 RepID=A0A2N3PHM0_9HELI|nr:polyphosphate kinase 2 [Helicobacter winghamensis]EEO26452.1 polyphosphate kinase 2 [Helicobacter winghamensis ATCC BAA-430]PKT75492.1 polyphosphate kinase 2 [Helicobacter winghamensis]PKT75659.1 polyphosphate kinase 2 [Helicobacter winghamensis]PKT75868.1 polyphosphate kinase 2 [Helicobacter winghamensis]PKT79957.1 polyphosphate kinase 2 [Helicobacter winghamensis]
MSKTLVVRPEDEKPGEVYNDKGKINKKFYEKEIVKLQIELIKLQNWVKKHQKKIIIILEGRDAAGKGGTIKALREHLNPRGARVVALQKPSDVEKTQWYFQRYIDELPNGGEIVFFDRSWYNRAGVEKVMDFCTNEQYKEFIIQVSHLEQMLIESGYILFKFFLDVGREEQRKRIESRKDEPLKRWKLSPIDELSLNLWDEYTEAFEKMFSRTHTPFAPWLIVDSNDKKRARINLARILLSKIDYEDKDAENVCLLADPGVVSYYSSVKMFSSDANREIGNKDAEKAKSKKEKKKKKDKE